MRNSVATNVTGEEEDWKGNALPVIRIRQTPQWAFPCAQCHQKEQSLKPILACITCHPTRTELHLKPTHSAAECTTCHIPHEWRVARRETCLGCHEGKIAHKPEGPAEIVTRSGCSRANRRAGDEIFS